MSPPTSGYNKRKLGGETKCNWTVNAYAVENVEKGSSSRLLLKRDVRVPAKVIDLVLRQGGGDTLSAFVAVG